MTLTNHIVRTLALGIGYLWLSLILAVALIAASALLSDLITRRRRPRTDHLFSDKCRICPPYQWTDRDQRALVAYLNTNGTSR